MSTTTPNMGLIVPGVGTEVGPNWANEINGDLSSIDQHNHTNGQGVPIPVAGLNINADLPMSGFNIVNPRTVRLEQLLTAPAATIPDVGVIYAAEVASNYELFYNDTAGNQVQITTAGSVRATSSGITGPGGASASFSGGVLIVNGATNTPGNIQAGSILFGNNTAGSNFATVSPPAALGANYAITLPPTNSSGGTVFMTYDSSNNMGSGVLVSKGITNANIANQTITQGLLAPKPNGGATATAGQVAISSTINSVTAGNTSYNLMTGLQVSIVTTGRPVYVTLAPGPGDNGSYVYCTATGSNNADGQMAFLNGVSIIGSQFLGPQAGTSQICTAVPSSSFNQLDLTVAGTPGTYTYTVQAKVFSSGGGMTFFNCCLMAWEI